MTELRQQRMRRLAELLHFFPGLSLSELRGLRLSEAKALRDYMQEVQGGSS